MYISMSLEPEAVEELQTTELENDSQKFTFKLLDRLGNPLMPQQVQVFNIQEGHDLYLTPHFFESIMQQNQCIRYNPYKGDTFALGIIVLKCGLMVDVSDLYNMETGTFSHDLLEEMKAEFVNIFNDAILTELLDLLLETDDSKRLSPRGIQQKMDQILNRLSERPEEMKTLEDAPETLPVEKPEKIYSDSGTEESESESEESVSQEESRQEESRQEESRQEESRLEESRQEETWSESEAQKKESQVDIEVPEIGQNVETEERQGESVDLVEEPARDVDETDPVEEEPGKAELSERGPNADQGDVEKFEEFVEVENPDTGSRKELVEEEEPTDEREGVVELEDDIKENEDREQPDTDNVDLGPEKEAQEEVENVDDEVEQKEPESAEQVADEAQSREEEPSQDPQIESTEPQVEEKTEEDQALAKVANEDVEQEQPEAEDKAQLEPETKDDTEFHSVEFVEEKPEDATEPIQDANQEPMGGQEDTEMLLMFNKKMNQIENPEQDRPIAPEIKLTELEAGPEQDEEVVIEKMLIKNSREPSELEEPSDEDPELAEHVVEGKLKPMDESEQPQPQPNEFLDERPMECGPGPREEVQPMEWKLKEEDIMKPDSEEQAMVEEVILPAPSKPESLLEEPSEKHESENEWEPSEPQKEGVFDKPESDEEVVEEVLHVADSQPESMLEEPSEDPVVVEQELPKEELNTNPESLGERESDEEVVEEVLHIANSQPESMLEEPSEEDIGPQDQVEEVQLEEARKPESEQADQEAIELEKEDEEPVEPEQTDQNDMEPEDEERVETQPIEIGGTQDQSDLEEPSENEMNVARPQTEVAVEVEPEEGLDEAHQKMQEEREKAEREYAELVEEQLANEKERPKTEDLVRMDTSGDVVLVDSNLEKIKQKYPEFGKQSQPEPQIEIYELDSEQPEEIPMQPEEIPMQPEEISLQPANVFQEEDNDDFVTGYDPRRDPDRQEEGEVVEIDLPDEDEPEEAKPVVELQLEGSDRDTTPVHVDPRPMDYAEQTGPMEDHVQGEDTQEVEEVPLPEQESNYVENRPETTERHIEQREPDQVHEPEFVIEGKYERSMDPQEAYESGHGNLISREMHDKPEEEIIYKVKQSLKEMILNEDELVNPDREESANEGPENVQQGAEPARSDHEEVELKDPNEPDLRYDPGADDANFEMKLPSQPHFPLESDEPVRLTSKTVLQMPEEVPAHDEVYHGTENISSKNQDYIDNVQQYYQQRYEEDLQNNPQPAERVIRQYDHYQKMVADMEPRPEPEQLEQPRRVIRPLDETEKDQIQRIKETYFTKPHANKVLDPGVPSRVAVPDQVNTIPEYQTITEYKIINEAPQTVYIQNNVMEPVVPAYEHPKYSTQPQTITQSEPMRVQPHPRISEQHHRIRQPETVHMQSLPRDSAPLSRPTDQATFSKKVEPESTVIPTWKSNRDPQLQHKYQTPERVAYPARARVEASLTKQDSAPLGEELPLSSVFKNTSRLQQNVKVFRNPESNNKRIVLNNTSRVNRVSHLGTGSSFWRGQDHRSVPIKKVQNYSQTRAPIVKQDLYNRQHSVSAKTNYPKIDRETRISVQTGKYFSQGPRKLSHLRPAESNSTSTPNNQLNYSSHKTPLKYDTVSTPVTQSRPQTNFSNSRVFTPGATSGEHRVEYTTRITPSTESKVIITRRDSRLPESSGSRVVKYIPTASLGSTAPKNSIAWTETEKNSFQPKLTGVLHNSFYPTAKANGSYADEKKFNTKDEYNFNSFQNPNRVNYSSSGSKNLPKESIVLSRQRNPQLPPRLSENNLASTEAIPIKGNTGGTLSNPSAEPQATDQFGYIHISGPFGEKYRDRAKLVCAEASEHG